MYKLHLILKYLRRRRIAWIALLAVILCTQMEIVVISIMGGWLRMYETSARGMTGDVVMKSPGLAGFAYYEEMIAEIQKLPYVEAAVPQIDTNGLVSIGFEDEHIPKKTEGVQVFGVRIDQIGRVNTWPQSLYKQHTEYLDRGEQPPATKSFDPHRPTSTVRLSELPSGIVVPPEFAKSLTALNQFLGWLPPRLRFMEDTLMFYTGFPLMPEEPATNPEPIWQRLTFNPRMGTLTVRGKISDDDLAAMQRAASNKDWRLKTSIQLASLSNRPGLIAGARLIDVRKDRNGAVIGRQEFKYHDLYATVTVLGVGIEGKVKLENRTERTYWIIDDSRTGMWQYDNKSVYVDFDTLQRDLDMQATEEESARTGEKVMRPARTSEVNIKLKPDADVNVAQQEIEAIAAKVLEPHRRNPMTRNYAISPRVQTWRDASRTYLDAIETEKVLVVFLFAIISMVAVGLIFCIFYMIVAEKTKDIGIIKSVGATNGGVAGIFLGYGLAIGIIGASLGLLLSYVIIHNINDIHAWLGRTFRIVVWNPEVYAFETIPSTMETLTVSVILVVAVLASVLGATVPAIRAARMHPVEALRWE